MKKVRQTEIWYAVAIGALVFILSLLALTAHMTAHTELQLRSRVVKLEGNGMLCSGEQVHSASGVDYILSAGHCMPLAVGDSVKVITEDGKELQRKVIAEDMDSDLMLIEGLPGLRDGHLV